MSDFFKFSKGDKMNKKIYHYCAQSNNGTCYMWGVLSANVIKCHSDYNKISEWIGKENNISKDKFVLISLNVVGENDE